MARTLGVDRNPARAPACGYVRVSTAEQAAEGVSIDAQRDRIEAYCASHGLALAETFEDRGISARRASNRPGLDAALSQTCRDGGTLVVYSLSRLARSVRDAIAIAERLERSGAELVLLAESIDTTTAAGRMFFHVLAALAQFESDLNGERVRLALDHTRGEGRRYCRHAPYGYRFRNGRIEEDADEQAVIGRIQRLRRQGRSYREIAERLRRAGIRNRAGRPLAHQSVAAIATQIMDGAVARPRRRRRRGQ